MERCIFQLGEWIAPSNGAREGRPLKGYVHRTPQACFYRWASLRFDSLTAPGASFAASHCVLLLSLAVLVGVSQHVPNFHRDTGRIPMGSPTTKLKVTCLNNPLYVPVCIA